MTDSRKALGQVFEEVSAGETPLPEKLAVYLDRQRQLSPEFAAVNDRMVARLASAHAGGRGPRVGDPMPAFLLPDETGRLVGLSELLERGPLVISFNRGHWCNFCRLELRALARLAPDLAQRGVQTVSIVPLRQPYARQLKAENALPFPVLTDMDSAYAMSLDLLIWVGDEIKATFEPLGIRLDAFQGNDGWMLPIPATFVVGRDGRVLARFVDPDFRQRMGEAEILEALHLATVA